MSLQTLNFHWLQYPATVFEAWLKNPMGPADAFVFAFYYPETSGHKTQVQACAFAYSSKNNIYYNPNNPDILAPYEKNVLELSGPLQFSVNEVSSSDLSSLLGPNTGANDFLLFEPVRDPYNRVYYNIQLVQQTANGNVISGTPVSTNPSPPATA